MYRLLFYCAVLASGILAGCARTANLPLRPRPFCPTPPPPECLPGKFSKITIDTSSAPSREPGYYLAIDRVEGLNTSNDEFSVAFQERDNSYPMDALSTIRPRNSMEWFAPTSFIKVDRAVVNSGLTETALEGAIGGGSRRGDSILYASRLPHSVTGDYDLFAAKYLDGKLNGHRHLDASLPTAWDAQPAYAPDGKAIYFVSDRRGSLGGTDIFVIRRGEDGAWGKPENMGPGINTPCDELSPFVSGDGNWLYFSSSGHSTVGGYDLFRAPIADGQAGGAQNLGQPINTTFDEISPSAPPGANPDTLLYYSSNQASVSNFDIYVLHRRKRALIANAPPPTAEEVKLTGTVRTRRGQPVEDADVRLEEGDPPKVKDSSRTNKNGRYEFDIKEGKDYEVTAGTDSTLFGREKVYVPVKNDKKIITQDIILPDTITFRVNFPFNNDDDPYEFTLDDQGLPTNELWKSVINRAAAYLKMIKKGKYLIEVVGHTDPLGTEPFNDDLGRRRAEFVRRELVKRGVRSDILSVRSEGETQPLPIRPNEPDEQYRARLRRVELVRKQ